MGITQLLVSQNCCRSCEDVPETHLHVCQVNVGEEEARQIVCDKFNARWHQGHGGSSRCLHRGTNHKDQKGKIRGLESLGMICLLQN